MAPVAPEIAPDIAPDSAPMPDPIIDDDVVTFIPSTAAALPGDNDAMHSRNELPTGGTFRGGRSQRSESGK